MKGIYLLEIELEKTKRIKVGALGLLTLPKGRYFYVGSAQNNMQKRIERHLSDSKKVRWHIDYLLSENNVKVINVYYKIAEKIEECITAKKMLDIGYGMKGFGSSDCKCPSHLIKLEHDFDPEKIGFYVFREQRANDKTSFSLHYLRSCSNKDAFF